MEPNKNYLLVGIFVLVGFLAIAFFSLWLTDKTEKKDYAYYQIVFHESVGGLNNGSSVKYRGVDIGNVVAINIDLNRADTIITRIRVLRGVPVRADTVATLKIQGITGSSYIELSGGSNNQSRIEGSPKNSGDLPEIPSRESNISTISNEVPELINSAAHLTAQVDRLINDESVTHVHNILRRWDSISEMMEKDMVQLDEMIKTSNHLLGTADRVLTDIDGAKFGETLQNMHETSIQFKSLATRANRSTETNLEEFSQLLQDARKTSQELRMFTRSLRENPSQIIFPTRDKQEKLP